MIVQRLELPQMVGHRSEDAVSALGRTSHRLGTLLLGGMGQIFFFVGPGVVSERHSSGQSDTAASTS